MRSHAHLLEKPFSDPRYLMKKITFYQCLLAAASIHGVATAAPVSSEPLGYTTTTLHGSFANGSRKNNIVSPNLVNAAAWQGTVASVNGDEVVLTGPAIAAGTFNAASLAPKRYSFYVNTADGYWAHIVSNTASAIMLPSGIAANFAVGESIIIRRHLTISDYLGSNEVGLRSSASGNIEQADRLTLVDQENGGNVVIFPSTILGGTWVNEALQEAGSYPIYPDQAVQISRSLPADLVLETTGEVDRSGRQIRVNMGTNIRPISLPTSVTLSDLLLYTGDPATGVVASDRGDVGRADNVRVTVNGVTSIYFYSTADLGAGAGWYTDSFEFAGDRVLPAGAAVVIKRSNSVNNASFIWKSPAPAIQ